MGETTLTAARPFKIFSGSSNRPFAQNVANLISDHLGQVNISRFSDGEIQCEIKENVRGLDAFVVQSLCAPTNDNLMELLIMGDALRRASTRTSCAVIPYYGYARQDRKTAPRTPITARLVADLIMASGFDRVIAVDLHAGQIQGFFNCPFDHLFPSPVSSAYLMKKYGKEPLTIVSPDAGGTERARIIAKKLDAPLAIVDKRRSAPNVAQAMNLIGEVEGRVAILIDDIVDTAGTLSEASRLLRAKGASKVVAYASHPVFSGPAAQRLSESSFDEIIVSDTIPLNETMKKFNNLTVLSLAPLIAETIIRIQRNDSVSALF